MVACQVSSGQRKWTCLPVCQSFPLCRYKCEFLKTGTIHLLLLGEGYVMEYQIRSTIAWGKKPQWASRKESTVFGRTFTGRHDNLLDEVFLCPKSHRNRRSWRTWAELRDLWDVQVWHVLLISLRELDAKQGSESFGWRCFLEALSLAKQNQTNNVPWIVAVPFLPVFLLQGRVKGKNLSSSRIHPQMICMRC